MNNKTSLFDKYSFYVWAIVILLVATIVLIPFIPGIFVTVFGISIYYTPALIVSPVLMGIIYAVFVSYETPKMTPKKKKVFRTIKIVDIALFYAYSIAVITTAAVRGIINF
ncbi:MAG: hypothetical protein IKT39_03110 [Clostridia bacterium]|nr:hypothetical protein [Clostridia bacterium]